MYKSLYVPLDGSPASEHALPFAVHLARCSRASIRLSQVHLPPLGIDENAIAVSLKLEEVRDLELRHLDNIVTSLRSLHSVEATAVLLEIPIVGSLLTDIEKHKPDLVVMTTHGRGSLSRLWLGSVADALIRNISVPILLLRPQLGSAELQNEPACRRMLVLLDGSPLAEQIIPHAVEIARLTQAECTLLQVIEPVAPITFYPPMGEGSSEIDREILHHLFEVQKDRQVAAEAYLGRAAERFRAEEIPTKTLVVANHPIAEGILKEAQAEQVDLIALATHGRGGLRRLILGSIADKVIRGTTHPILVVRPQDDKQ